MLATLLPLDLALELELVSDEDELDVEDKSSLAVSSFPCEKAIVGMRNNKNNPFFIVFEFPP
jgi:hypothetical protein